MTRRTSNISGAHLIVLINGRRWGVVQAFDFQAATPRTALMGIDTLLPQELTPGGVSGNGSMSIIRQEWGGLEGRGLVGTPATIPIEQYFSILIINRKDQSTFFRSDYNSVTGQQVRTQARQMVALSFSFQSLSWTNEHGDLETWASLIGRPPPLG